MGVRTANIEKNVEVFSKNNSTIYQDNNELIENYQKSAKLLENLMMHNTELFDKYGKLAGEVEHFQDIQTMKNEYNDMNEHLNRLDKLVLLTEYEQYIKKVKELISSQEQEGLSSQGQTLYEEVKQHFDLGIVFQLMAYGILGTIVFLLILIVRKINEKERERNFQ